jgi:hypothetical protein
MQLTIEQLKHAIEREKQMVVRYTLSKSPALAKFYQKQAKKYEEQLEAELAKV